jgi:hypothetical protein
MKKHISVAFVALLSVFVISLTGCEESDLGRYCVVGFDNTTGGEGVKAINSEAPECLDRICILQTMVSVSDTEEATELETIQYCSKKCSSDSDCKSADSSANCSQGFVCILMGQESKDLDGKCICECKDFLTKADLCYSRCSISNRDKDEMCDSDTK